MSLSKSLLLNALSVPWVAEPFRLVVHRSATIFMLHRFADKELGTEGLDPTHLRRGLAYLRKHRYPVLSVEEIFRRIIEGNGALRGAVAFTMDDGYVDQALVGGPVFAEFDCPVTTFVATGFLDWELWFWWDQVEFIFANTFRRTVSVKVGGAEVEYRCRTPQERLSAQSDFIGRCKKLQADDINVSVESLAQRADVDLPRAAPSHYAPMSWDQVRACERQGMTFGPHTATHPILSRVSAARAHRELSDSWDRLCAEAARPVPVFCYPNGRYQDFGPRDVDILRALGFIGAVVGEPGYADASWLRRQRDGRFMVRRLAYPDNLLYMIQYVSGVERMKQLLRRES